jgi:hypothetical protein
VNPITGVPPAVDYLLAAAAILGAVAWPVVLLIVLLAFRRPLRDALEHLIEFRFGSTVAKFSREGGEVGASLVESLVESKTAEPNTAEQTPRPALRDLYAERAESNPLSAILLAYGAVESWYDQMLTERGIENHSPGHRKLGVRDLSRLAVERGLLPDSTLRQVDGLSIMRDLAVHGRVEEVTSEQAREYLVLVDGLLYSLDSELAKSGK